MMEVWTDLMQTVLESQEGDDNRIRAPPFNVVFCM